MCNVQGWGTELVCMFEALAHRIFVMLLGKLTVILPFLGFVRQIGRLSFPLPPLHEDEQVLKLMLVLS